MNKSCWSWAVAMTGWMASGTWAQDAAVTPLGVATPSSALVAVAATVGALTQSSRADKNLEQRMAVELARDSKWGLSLMKGKAPFLTDRKYSIQRLPRGTYGGTLLVRDSHAFERWLPENQLTAKEDCTLFVAIQTKRNQEVRVSHDLAEQMKKAGWTAEKGRFGTTSADKEVWIWSVFSKEIKAGPVNVKAPIASRTGFIFMFK